MSEQSAARILAGVATPLVDIRIVDAEGNDVPHDGEAVGEVVARAPWLTEGYLKEPEKSAELWEGGWLHTGDVGSINSRNTLQIKDRIKDVIKTGGEWISTIELENLISKHPGVSEVAVVGVPDERWDERPVATIVLREGVEVTSDAIKTHLKQFVDSGEIAKWAIPERIEFVYEIPKTSVGKINKKLIRSELNT